jgi:DNA-binding response OmpR family regulator
MNILVVHNNNEFLYLIIDVLKCSGHMPMKAVGMKDAREILEIDKVDLVVVESSWVQDDGIRFHSYVREISDCPDTPFIFITDKNEGRIEVQASSLNHFLDCREGAISILDMMEEMEFAVECG